MTFYRGQKVVYVDDQLRVSWRRKGWWDCLRQFQRLDHNLNRGDVYEIAGVADLPCRMTGQIYQGLFLTEAWHFNHRDIPFPSFQFRPLVERKTDISVFTAMLDRSRQTERA